MQGQQLQALSARVQTIDRQGVDGHAYRTDAQKSEETTKYTTATTNSKSTANQAASSYAAIKGTLQTVEDDMGRSVENILIIDVRVTRVFRVLNPSPAGNDYVIEAAWTLRATQV